MVATTYSGWLAEGKPARTATPIRYFALSFQAHGYQIGRTDVIGLGDERHLTASPPEDHTPYSHTPWPGSQPYPTVNAWDLVEPVPPGMPSLAAIARKVIADKSASRPELGWLKYMNWTDEQGRAWHESWKPNRATTTTTDKGHLHFSARTDYAFSAVAATYDPVAEILGDDMSWTDPLPFTVPTKAALEGEPTYGASLSAPARDVAWYTLVRAHIAQRAAEQAAQFAKTAAERPAVDPAALAAALVANPAFVGAIASAVAAALPHPLTAAETEQAAFEGAQRAEDS